MNYLEALIAEQIGINPYSSGDMYTYFVSIVTAIQALAATANSAVKKAAINKTRWNTVAKVYNKLNYWS